MDGAAERIEGLSGEPLVEKVSGSHSREIERSNPLGQRHACKPLVGSQQSDAVVRAGLRLMMPRRFEDQSVDVGRNRDTEVQVRKIAVALGLKCAAQWITEQVGSFDLRIRLQLKA